MGGEEQRLTPRDGAELLRRLERAWADLDALLAAVPPDRLDAPGPDGAWSVKDHLAHVATWARVATSRARGGYSAEAEAPLFGLGVAAFRATTGEDLNQATHRLHRHTSANEVLAGLREAHARLTATIETLGEAHLALHWLPGRPERGTVIDVLAGNSYEHYREHAAAIRVLVDGPAGTPEGSE